MSTPPTLPTEYLTGLCCVFCDRNAVTCAGFTLNGRYICHDCARDVRHCQHVFASFGSKLVVDDPLPAITTEAPPLAGVALVYDEGDIPTETPPSKGGLVYDEM